MFDQLILFSIRNKLLIGFCVLGLIIWGVFSFTRIPLDAVPDITNNQVQVITQSPTLSAQEVEQFITFSIETSMANLPDVVEIRSISRFGLSVITIVFKEETDIYRARQLISEQLKIAESEIPAGFGKPELGPITTGLGEFYQYILRTEPGYDSIYSPMDLRTINDWVVRRQMAGIPGVIEVSGWGGFLKQYEVAVDPDRLNSMGITISEVFKALEMNNENTGGSYIEKRYNTYFIRGEGLVKSLKDLEDIVVRTIDGTPILIRDIAIINYGSAPRYGAITYNGMGEVVGGQALMLKGENSYQVVKAVQERIEKVKKSLPEGVVLQPFIDRSELISRAIGTVTTNLIEGGLIVILILVLMLGNFRGGLIVATVIPLSMLFALGMMHLTGVSANLMSLGAIDFGLIVDGSVIVVEAIVHRIRVQFQGQQLSREKMDKEVYHAASKIRSSAAFGEIIILIVYLPILALVGIEGKMFTPMAQVVSFAIGGALILSLTYVPMMSALFLSRDIKVKQTFSDKIMAKLQRWYAPMILFSLRKKALIIVTAIGLFVASLFTFNQLGGEFIPVLEEGDFALHQILPPGSSLAQSVEVSEKIQNALLEEFPEVEMAVSKIGSSEIPTDPMPIEVGDIMVRMRPKEEWTTAKTKEEMFEKMEVVLNQIPGVNYEFTQPIQMRFNELIAGVREDIAIKIFGENPEILLLKAKEVEKIINSIDGVGDLRVEQTDAIPQMMVEYERSKIARYGLNIHDLNSILRAAFAGEAAGVVFEGEKRFDLVVRMGDKNRQSIDDLKNLFVPLPNGSQIPLKEVAKIHFQLGPAQISRENARRRIVIGVNARNRDMEGLVEEIQERIEAELELPPGYFIRYGGQIENLLAAKKRLSLAVPAALLLILILLFITFKSIQQALLIFTAIPLSAIGGVYALWLRDMPFSISAGIGFIALFGVAVLNGIVLIAYFNQLKKEGMDDLRERILIGTKVRLRPVLMTAAVAALGFLPMALSSSAGAEVQRPLATVVIGGLISATLLTLLVLPVLYAWIESWRRNPIGAKMAGILLPFIFVFGLGIQSSQAQEVLGIADAVGLARKNHPSLKAASLAVEQREQLKKTGFDPSKTQLSYTNGQINASTIDYQLEVNQQFRFPTAYLARSKVLKGAVLLEETRLEVNEDQLEFEVRQAWINLVYARQVEALNSQLEDHYKRFAYATAKRFATGEVSLLEKTAAEARWGEIQLEKSSASSDAAVRQYELQQWMFIGEKVKVPLDLKRVPPSLPDSTAFRNNPRLKLLQQQIDLAEKEQRLERSNYLPDLSAGYFSQQIEGVGGLQGFKVGVQIPLFYGAQKGKTKAAQLEVEIAQNQYEANAKSMEIQFLSKLEALAQQSLTLDYYDSKGLTTAKELENHANKSYKAGDIDYTVYVTFLSQSFAIRKHHLAALHQYNQLLTELQFLSGTFK